MSTFLLVVAAGVLGTAHAAVAAPTPQDLDYLNAAHQVNLTIIQAGEAAKTQGRTACVRNAGAQLEREHRTLAAQELQAASQLQVGLVPIPSQAQRERLNAVAAKAGTSGYDAAWLALMEQEHRDYLTLIADELSKGSEPVVKSVAESAQPVVQMHLRTIDAGCRTRPETPTVPTGDGGQMANAQQTRSLVAFALIGIGVLLLAGKPIRARRHLLGLSAALIGIALLTAGPPGDAGQVPGGRVSVADREAAIPPTKLGLPGYLNAPIVPVAIDRDGQLQVPKAKANVGWWAAGAAPGSAGGTVLLVGHVDSVHQKRGVFAALWDVPVGARVEVTAADGKVHRYRIVARRTYQQEQLPKDLFRGAAKPRLALVTCTGPYNHAEHRYTHNLVVYGVPA